MRALAVLFTCALLLSPSLMEEADVQVVDAGAADSGGLASGSSAGVDVGAADDLDAPEAADETVELSVGGIQCTAVDRCHVAGTPWTDADVRAALVGRSLVVRRIVFCEIGRSGVYDAYAVGSLGEVGPAQLLPGRGNGLEIFRRWGYDEPNNPYQAVAFIEEVIDRGMLQSQYPRTSRGCPGSV